MNISKHAERFGSRVHSMCSATLALCNGGAALALGAGAIASVPAMMVITAPAVLISGMAKPIMTDGILETVVGPSKALLSVAEVRLNAASDNVTMAHRLHRFARGKEWETPDPNNFNLTPSEQKKYDKIIEKIENASISSPKLISWMSMK